MFTNRLFKLWKRTYTSEVKGLIVSKRNDKAIIQFNRPEKRNAMSIEILVKLASALRELECDPSVSAVILKGSEAGFSAGGDVVEFIEMMEADASKKRLCECLQIFYRSLLRIAEFKKPVISLADKICMGGGAAVAFLSSHPVITERTVFAMPEVFIGFYPNVAANYFMVHLPHNIGMWLGLTGQRLIGSDIVKVGLSKNCVKSDDMNKLEEALINMEQVDNGSVSKTIAEFQQKSDFIKTDVDVNKIEKLFNEETLEQIVENLKNDGSDFSKNILELFLTSSPTALKITFNLFRQSQLKQYSTNEALSADFSLFLNFYCSSLENANDFREGVRSVLVDKQHKPNWIPNNLHLVDDKKLITYFTKNIVDIRLRSP